MTVRATLIMLIAGAIIGIIGAIFMFQHWPMAGFLLVASTIMVNSAIVILAIKALQDPRAKELLDS